MGNFVVPPAAMVYSGPSGTESLIEQYKAQSRMWHALGDKLGAFLGKAFPKADAEAGELADALVELMDCGTQEQIERMEASLKMPPPHYGPPATPESLMRLIEERDRAQGAIEQLETLDTVAPEMKAIMNAAVDALGLYKRLNYVNDEISRVQAQLEAQEVPQS
jgi:hypothetical protein